MAWEYSVMMAIQSISDFGGGIMDTVFAVFTFFGEESFLLIAVFAIYWCIDKKLGEYLLLSLFTSISLNGLIKDIVRRPRPFLTEAFDDMRYVKVNNIFVDTETLGKSFSFPSGHSQCSGGFFTSIALWLKKRWVSVFAVIMIAAVMASRVYLGVHFPSDVLVGAVLGIASSMLCFCLFKRFYAYKILLFAAVVLLSLSTLFLTPSADTVKTIGVGIGAVCGLMVDVKITNFTVDGTISKRILRLFCGAALIFTIRLGLKIIFPQKVFFDGLRYAIVGFVATGLVPWLFTKYHI